METGDTDRIGAQPGSKYQIVEPLKTGGSAAIYLAVMRGENDFTREVVVKRPLPHLVADRRLRAMFIDEAHIASRLSHPNIVQVIDLVAREDEVYMVLEYLKGRDVREILKRCAELGRLIPTDIAVWTGAEMCGGLHAAHDAVDSNGSPLNLVHRDVSPKNVRVTDRGAVKLIDFGIARVEHRITETAPGSVKGTMGYMSPEQVMGDVIDRRSDVFAVGICLFQMLSGRNPFDAPDLKGRIHLLIHAPVPSVRDFNPSVDETLARIVARCLDRDVAARYPTAGEVQHELEAYLAELRVASPRQRLVDFLEDIFPDIHDAHPKLQEVLSTMSGLEARSDELLSWGGELDEDTRMSAAPEAPPSTEELPSTQPHPPASVQPAPVAGPRSSQSLLWVVMLLAAALIGMGAWIAGRLSTGPQEITTRPLEGQPPSLVLPSDSKPNPTEPIPPPDETQVAKQKVAKQKVARTKKPVTKKPVTKKPVNLGSNSARAYFQAGVHRARQGAFDDALFLYKLSYAVSGRNVNPAIYRNLGLAYRKLGRTEKVRACFDMYLLKNPSGTKADQIRSILSALPATKASTCVSDAEARVARKRAGRIGAKIDAWVKAAGGGTR